MNQQVINKEKLEYLKTYITTFARAYMLATGKKLTTVDQILELIESGEFTFEDMFDVYLGEAFKYGDLSEEAIVTGKQIGRASCRERVSSPV